MACIHLVRHLATEGAPATWLDRAGLQAWFDVEGARGITAGSAPSRRLVAAVAASRPLLVSPQERAQATARSVLAARGPDAGPGPVVITDPDLIEIPLPVLPMPGVRLPLDAWDAACRTAWLLGYRGRIESRGEAVARARRAAERAAGLAEAGRVTVIGHGFTNILLARHLRRLGWCGPRLPDHRNGGVTSYRRS
jgi:broad specificity phosphatase PhoE